MKVALATTFTMLVFSAWLNIALWTQTIVRPIWVSDDISAMQAAAGAKK